MVKTEVMADTLTINVIPSDMMYDEVQSISPDKSDYSLGDYVNIAFSTFGLKSSGTNTRFDRAEISGGYANKTESINHSLGNIGFVFSGEGDVTVTLYYIGDDDRNLQISKDSHVASVSPTSATKKEGETVDITATVSEEGYEFDRWTIVSGSGSFASATSASTVFTMDDADAEIKANSKLKTYTVQFSGNGVNITPINSQTVQHGSKATNPGNPTTTVAGKVFQGWYKEAACTNAWNFNTDTVTEPTTIYAKWSNAPTTYTVTFNLNGGNNNGDTSNVTRTTGTDGKLTEFPEVQYDGHTLVGWFDEDADPDTAVELDKVYTRATTLTAHWTETPVFVSASIGAPSQVVKGQSYNIPVTFTFNRTLTDVDAYNLMDLCAVEYAPNYRSGVLDSTHNNMTYTITVPFSIPSNASGNLTLNARYNTAIVSTKTIPIVDPSPTTNTVTFRVVNGKWNDDSTGNKTEQVETNGHLTEAQIPTVGSKPNAGYKAGSWSPSTPSSSTAITEDIEYTYTYASESAKTYTVAASDDGHGSAKASPTSGTTGTRVTITATPDRDYQFKEWRVIRGGVDLDNRRRSQTTFNIGNANVEVKAIFEKKDRKKDDDDDDDDHEDSSSPAPAKPVNPNAIISSSFTTTGGMSGIVKIGPQVQGPAAQAVFKANTPAGWKEAFSFNMTVNDKADYTLKKGILSFKIPSQYLKAGRKFAILGIDKNGKVKMFPDIDTKDDTITVNIDIEGYAFDLIYFD